MRYHQHMRGFIGAVILAASTVVVAAAPNDYRFELVQAQPAGPGKTTVTVRLGHVPDNKPVAGAVLFESKTDMGPRRANRDRSAIHRAFSVEWRKSRDLRPLLGRSGCADTRRVS